MEVQSVQFSQRFLLCLLFISHTALIPFATIAHEQSTHQTDVNAIDIEKQIISELGKNLITQLETIELVLNEIAGRLNNKDIAVKDPKTLRNDIKQIKNRIHTMLSSGVIYIDAESLSILVQFTQQIIEQINQGLDSGLVSIPDFDTEIFRSRTNTTLTIQELFGAITRTQDEIEMISTKAKIFGLTRFNRAFRRAEKLNSDYKLTSKFTKLCIVAGVAGLALYKIPESWLNPNSKPIQKEGNSLLDLLTGRGRKTNNSSSLLSFSRIPRPRALMRKRHFIIPGKFGWLGKALSTIKHRLGKAPTITNGMITKPGTGLFGTLETFQKTAILSMVEMGVPQALPFVYTMFNEDIKNIRKRGKLLWNWARNKMRGGKPIKKSGTFLLTVPKIRFKDVIGNEYQKQVLRPIIEYVCNPDHFDRSGIRPPKGVLFVGPSRTGKTHFATATAGEIRHQLREQGNMKDFPFLTIPASLVSEWGIDSILEAAKEMAPCILFFDEIDLLKLQRDRDPQALSKFLTSMSGCLEHDPNKQVIIIATTNKEENLDFALLQPGRFGQKLYFQMPSLEDRKKFLVKEFDNRCLNENMFDINQLALETANCSYDTMNATIIDALSRAKARHAIVSQQDFKNAINKVVHKIIPFHQTISKQELERIAAYQASKAVATTLLNPDYIITKITIKPITKKVKEESIYKSKSATKQKAIQYGKVFSYLPQDTLTINSREQKIAQIKIILAGHTGATLIDKRSYGYNTNDKQKAIAIAQELLLDGMKLFNLSKAKQDQLLDDALDLVNKCEKEITELLGGVTDKTSLMIDALLELHTIEGSMIQEILNPSAQCEEQTDVDKSNDKMVNKDIATQDDEDLNFDDLMKLEENDSDK